MMDVDIIREYITFNTIKEELNRAGVFHAIQIDSELFEVFKNTEIGAVLYEEAKLIRPRKSKKKYVARASILTKRIFIGLYDSYEAATNAIFYYKLCQFAACITACGYSPHMCKKIHEKYFIWPDGTVFNSFGRKLGVKTNKSGYKCVVLGRNCNELLHRLIAEAFIPNPNNLPIINHIDGNKLNNSIENLEWCTHSQNTLHAYETGLTVGKKCAPALSIREKEYIRQHLLESSTKIAKEIGRSAATVVRQLRKYRKEAGIKENYNARHLTDKEKLYIKNHITSSPIEIANAIGRGKTTVRRYIDFYRKTKLL